MSENNKLDFQDPELARFIQELRISKPTHYGLEDPTLQESFKNFRFIHFGTDHFHPILVAKMCVVFVTKYATLNPGTEFVPEKLFFASMPIAIWSSDRDKPDRTLVWGNGGVTLTADNELVLHISLELAERILQIANGADHE